MLKSDKRQSVGSLMTVKTSSVSSIIIKISSLVKKKLKSSNAKLISEFVSRYLANLSMDDLTLHNIDEYVDVIVEHWLLFKQFDVQKLLSINAKQDPTTKRYQLFIVMPDMPFLVDSINMEITRHNYTKFLMINSGAIKVQRKNHLIQKIFAEDANLHLEANALIFVELNQSLSPDSAGLLIKDIKHVISDIKMAVDDWHNMRAVILKSIEDINQTTYSQISAITIAESKAFLQWLLDDNFTFLGTRDYEHVVKQKKATLQIIKKSSYGVLKDERGCQVTRDYNDIPSLARKIALSNKTFLIIGKTNTIATVHRPVYSDYIGVKKFNEKGALIGEQRIIGLFTSSAYHASPFKLPLLRQKVNSLLVKSKLPASGYAIKKLIHIINTIPRDDLFQATVDDLYALSMGILQLHDRTNTRLFVVRDIYMRYVSCLVYISRESFNTSLIKQIISILKVSFESDSYTYSLFFPNDQVVRIHCVLRINDSDNLKYNIKLIEMQIIEVARSWQESLAYDLIEYKGLEKGMKIAKRYQHAFPAGYRENFTALSAIKDISKLSMVTEAMPLNMRFYQSLSRINKNQFNLKLFHCLGDLHLSNVMPIFDSFGLQIIEEQSYQTTFEDGHCLWINDFSMQYPHRKLVLDEIKSIFNDAFINIWDGSAETDELNSLILQSSLTWRQVSLIRAYTKYLRQLNLPFSLSYVSLILNKYNDFLDSFIKFFDVKFNPSFNGSRELVLKRLDKRMQKEIAKVQLLDEERILRYYRNLLKSTLRTNYFQLDENGKSKTYLSFKVASSEIIEMPLPRPLYEIFAYSPRFEGIHLRTSKIARGGLRWSSRQEDFRTEILGLVKAQKVKNAVIIPSGAKGGFVPKKIGDITDKNESLKEGLSCYKLFINSMLDITDNIIDSKIIKPKDCVCYDGDDPYFVVAADRGTATFSDYANEIAINQQFWLGDAFASGGSNGYDHKKLGITARGAWEAVCFHLRTLGKDPQKDIITTIGIGDMSGDVFGNGMLLSNKIKLIAAFNHQYIFLDPNPDLQTSYNERLRLFNAKRSDWCDYDAECISNGGGIYSRFAKSIKLSSNLKKILHTKKAQLTPNELLRIILKANVDLIWNGGIGTFVKSEAQSNRDAEDTSNNAIRVNGSELSCKMFVEGGNLGATQPGRIEYELSGGIINTDFIDNSAGVDCSDHEVNIKIFLNGLVQKGDLAVHKRNSLLHSMEQEVAALVLNNNYQQNKVITLAAQQSNKYLNLYQQFIKEQESLGNLNPVIEFLPDDELFAERKSNKLGLTRPEISVLLSYAKIVLYSALIKNDELINDKFLQRYFRTAFPLSLNEKFPHRLLSHRLYKEITATQISNKLINDMTVTFIPQLEHETNASIVDVVKAYLIAREIFDMDGLWADIEILNDKISFQLQTDLMQNIIQVIRRAARWLLRHAKNLNNIEETIARYKRYVPVFYEGIPQWLVGDEKVEFEHQKKRLQTAGVPEHIAIKMASTQSMYSLLNIVSLVTKDRLSFNLVVESYFYLVNNLGLLSLREYINNCSVDSRWAVLSRAGFKMELDILQRKLTVKILKSKLAKQDKKTAVENWLRLNQDHLKQWNQLLVEMKNPGYVNYAIISVALTELKYIISTV